MTVQVINPPAIEPVTLDEAKLHLRVDASHDDVLISGLIAVAREYAEGFQNRSFISTTWRLFLDAFPWSSCNAIRLPRPPLQTLLSVKYLDEDGEEQTLIEGDDYEVDLLSDPGRVRPIWGESWPTALKQMNAVWIDFVSGYATKVTASDATELVTCTGDRLVTAGHLLRFQTTGTLPAPLVVGTAYYARDVSGGSFKVSETPAGNLVNITTAGTGVHTLGEVPGRVKQAILLLVAHWYEHREAVVIGATPAEIPMAVNALLWQERFF